MLVGSLIVWSLYGGLPSSFFYSGPRMVSAAECGGRWDMGRQSALGWVPRWLSAAAVGLGACALLLGPVVLFGGFALRASLIDLNARSDRERQDTATLAAGFVAR